MTVPLWLLIGGQVFRVAVELIIHHAWTLGLAPKMLTYSGANIDIWIGLSAPLIAWLSTRGGVASKIALAWNFLGLLALANVILRSILTAPGPSNMIATELPNLMVGTFPFAFIPGFFAPLAIILHILAIKQIRNSARTSRAFEGASHTTR